MTADSTPIIVGIDLGTTNSEIAIVRDGRVEVIPVAGPVRILPSVVGIGDDGVLLVGMAARRLAQSLSGSVRNHMITSVSRQECGEWGSRW